MEIETQKGATDIFLKEKLQLITHFQSHATEGVTLSDR